MQISEEIDFFQVFEQEAKWE